MKRTNILVSIIWAVFAISASTFGQDAPADARPQEGSKPAAEQPQDIRSNILRQLGLSREQIQQIRRINIERKPLMDAAQLRSRDAVAALDAAIYADQINEEDVRTRLKEVQLAQAEVSRIRFMNEVAVRRILTPEQLVRFRELRERFERIRKRIDESRPLNRRFAPVENTSPANDTQPAKRFVTKQGRRPLI